MTVASEAEGHRLESRRVRLHACGNLCRGWASATNDRREFQRTIGAGTSKPTRLDVVVVHSIND
jgi:hypothetical protein